MGKRPAKARQVTRANIFQTTANAIRTKIACFIQRVFDYKPPAKFVVPVLVRLIEAERRRSVGKNCLAL